MTHTRTALTALIVILITLATTTAALAAYAPDGITRTRTQDTTPPYTAYLPVVMVNRGIAQANAPDDANETHTPAKLDQPIQLDQPAQDNTACQPGQYRDPQGPHPCPQRNNANNQDAPAPDPAPDQPKNGNGKDK